MSNGRARTREMKFLSKLRQIRDPTQILLKLAINRIAQTFKNQTSYPSDTTNQALPWMILGSNLTSLVPYDLPRLVGK